MQGSNNYPVVFGQLTKCDGAFLVGRTSQPDFKWSDLVGKEIIGGRKGGMPAMSLEYALSKNKLVPGSNINLNYDIQFDLITAAFEGGTGDYCTMFEPGASQYVAAGKGHIVASVGKEAGAIPYTCFMATKEYIEKNPDRVANFMRAILKAIEFVTVSSDEIVAEKIAPSFPTTKREMLVKSVKNYKAIDAFMTSPLMTESSFEHMLDILTESGSINKRLAFSDLIDNSIIEKILAEK